MAKYVDRQARARMQKRKQKKARQMAGYASVVLFILVISFGITSVIKMFSADDEKQPLLENPGIQQEEISGNQEIRVHEYGHVIQSVVLGPLFLIPGFISLAWANLPYYIRLRRKRPELRYTSCFVESWASKWGEKITGENAIWD